MKQFGLGALLALAGHGVAFLAGFAAAQLVKPSPGGGFEDVAAVALTFLGFEALVGLASLVGGIVLLAKGRRQLGSGVLTGWLIGVVAVFLLLQQ